MATIESERRGKTSKLSDVVHFSLMLSTGKTLGNSPPSDLELRLHKVTKFLSCLCEHLVESGSVSIDEIDEFLCETLN